MLMFGNLLSVTGVTDRLGASAGGVFVDVLTFLLGMTVGAMMTLAIAFLDESIYVVHYGLALLYIFIGLSYRYKPSRMDYSLFLRLIKGVIPESPNVELKHKLSREEGLAFARFLSERWLVVHVRERKEALQLRLASVEPSVWHDGFSPFIWGGNSVLTVALDGHIQVRLGSRDQESLARLQGYPVIQGEQLESRVEEAANQALHAFLTGDKLQAERCLGQQPEEEIFHVKPQHSKAVRWRECFMIGIGLLMVVLATWSLLRDAFFYPAFGRRLKAVQVSENEVRTALAGLNRNSDQEPEIWEALDCALRALDSEQDAGGL